MLPTIEYMVLILRVEIAHQEHKLTEIFADKYWVSCYYLDIGTKAKAALDDFINKL